VKDKKVRSAYATRESGNLAFLFFQNTAFVDLPTKLLINKKYGLLNKRFFKSQVKNRCVVSFRSRSTLRSFRLSRVIFRSYASGGKLLGIKKSSW